MNNRCVKSRSSTALDYSLGPAFMFGGGGRGRGGETRMTQLENGTSFIITRQHEQASSWQYRVKEWHANILHLSRE